MYQSKEIIKKQTATEMAEAYAEACDMIRDCYRDLSKAQVLLETAFGTYTHYGNFDVIDRNSRWSYKGWEECANDVIDRLRKSAWKRILDILEVDKTTTIKRMEEVRKSLESGKLLDGSPLPEIRVETIYEIILSFVQNAPGFQEELYQEVWELLRPNPHYYNATRYKTNNTEGIGKKVILTWMIDEGYGSGFRVSYGRSHDQLMAIDKVFHLLDGKGVVEGYNGPLVDAINSSKHSGVGETEYFKFRCYQNRNLHLEFKRMDLVEKLNVMFGGANLKSGKNGRKSASAAQSGLF